MEHAKLYVEVQDGVRCTYRDLHESELRQTKTRMLEMDLQRKIIRDAQAKLAEITKAMQEDDVLSKVFYDEPGFPYDVRHFVLTGKTSLI